MYGHRPGPGIRMILAQKGIICRAKECFATSGSNGTQNDKPKETCRQTGKSSGHAPEYYTQGCNPLAAEAIPGPAADRNHDSIEKIENSGDKAHRCVCKVQ